MNAKKSFLSWCANNGHSHVTTTQGITNRCVYCGKRAQWWNLGHMQVGK